MVRNHSGLLFMHGRCKTSKPFILLPLIVTNCLDNAEGSTKDMAIKNTGLRLFTKARPKKTESKKTRDERPLTATLERPTVIDIRFVGKIDMSLVRKEFLNITNLCRIPILVKKKQIPRPLSLPPPSKKMHKQKKALDAESSCEEDKSGSKKSNPKAKKPVNCDANNNCVIDNPRMSCGQVRKRLAAVTGIKTLSPKTRVPAKGSVEKSTKQVSEPCNSCGRKDQPERFHSHPVAQVAKTTRPMEQSVKPPAKSTVQKPRAMKYISKLTNQSTRTNTRQTKIPTTLQKIEKSSNEKLPNTERLGSGKRTLTCYLCGREFGTASLSLHEPKCLQKWEFENSNLPKHLQRKAPIKPSPTASKEEREEIAWKSSQAQLIPCRNCGRTFYADRLIVHQRSCKSSDKSKMDQHNGSQRDYNAQKSSDGKRPLFKCSICGRFFGEQSIDAHEHQCIKMWTLENDSLPPDVRSPPPFRIENKKSPRASVSRKDCEENPSPPTSSASNSARKPPLFPCYICGKLFTVNSIYIHEPQCLKMWKIENDRLPPNKRKAQPLKPDIKFTPSGGVDFEGTFKRIWENHLAELAECKKCGRKFFPDRIEKHETACANIRVNVKKQ